MAKWKVIHRNVVTEGDAESFEIVEAERYNPEGDWFHFMSGAGTARVSVMRIRQDDVERIERVPEG